MACSWLNVTNEELSIYGKIVLRQVCLMFICRFLQHFEYTGTIFWNRMEFEGGTSHAKPIKWTLMFLYTEKARSVFWETTGDGLMEPFYCQATVTVWVPTNSVSMWGLPSSRSMDTTSRRLLLTSSRVSPWECAPLKPGM